MKRSISAEAEHSSAEVKSVSDLAVYGRGEATAWVLGFHPGEHSAGYISKAAADFTESDAAHE
ncbi:MAG TPA: hypothetical protein VHW45_11575 [Candidatus Sulfotelmatobacter sp.]|nr:hypothetical protein [Candidatus Sulfotelmatobacter sp.]